VVGGAEMFGACADRGDVDAEVAEDAVVAEGDEAEGVGVDEPGGGDEGGGGV